VGFTTSVRHNIRHNNLGLGLIKAFDGLGVDLPQHIFDTLLEFFREAFRRKLYESIESPQLDLDEWLYYYNRAPHKGYRNMGRRPIERLDEHLQNVREEG
jgi:hypothetical protein